ncbi:unnamed protein product [Didymodactylos carnosus]|uniref:Uncharacterized protein n=1 Tax=Didymodactylos carnosus TaxID=1234261 RepID=A0A8S2H8Y2_9BILA|nr:unnamed protein product [Didymodactylos carnosus]CAF3615500.1 unnamed protein product [Didymodactylos carnosus]
MLSFRTLDTHSKFVHASLRKFPLTTLDHVNEWFQICENYLDNIWNNTVIKTSAMLYDAIDTLLSLTTAEIGELETLHIVNHWLVLHLSDLLKIVIDEEQQNERQIHPLGFIRIVLLSTKHFKCRLHYRKNNAAFKEDIHNHKCNFSAIMIHGGYCHEIFHVKFNNKNLQYLNSSGESGKNQDLLECYRFRNTGQMNEQEHTGTALNSKIQSYDLINDDCTSYALPSHIYHRVANPSPCLITLTLRGTVRNKEDCVFLCDRVQETKSEMETKSLDKNEVNSLFQEILVMLSSAEKNQL